MRHRSYRARSTFCSARREAEAIAALVPASERLLALGFDAHKGLATSPALASYRILHIATHGFIDDVHPELSGLALSNVDAAGQPREGFLRLHEVYNLTLPADLVTLSACSTALGEGVRGEGLVGLARGFFYAGASRLVVSLWKVDDQATAELMPRMYQGIFQQGLPPSAALRQAQQQLRREASWQHPFYWAGFELQGEWR